MLCGGATELVVKGYETLVEAGYQPAVAYYECLHELKLIVDLLHEGGITKMHRFISETAKYGDLTRGPRIVNKATKKEMRKILDEIQQGKFARQWIAENKNGRRKYSKLLKADLTHSIEKVGAQLRARMPWLESGKGLTAMARAHAVRQGLGGARGRGGNAGHARGPVHRSASLHEVTSPQAFSVLEVAGLPVRRPDRTLATMDHSTPTSTDQVFGNVPIKVDAAAKQVRQLERNAAEFGVELFGLRDARRGIVHVISPELGATQPGMTIVCGDSHTSTHGAFGALAFGIGTTEVGPRVRDAMPAAAQAEDLCAINVEGQLQPGRDGEGSDPGHHRQDRRIRRHRPRLRISRLRRSARCRWKSA